VVSGFAVVEAVKAEGLAALDVLAGLYRRQKYHLVGTHSAVKRCRWLYESIVHGRACYKQKFYGISSHRCIQMTPTLYYCSMQCLFCWRIQTRDLDSAFVEPPPFPKKWDSPEEIVEGTVREQLRLLSGYKGNPKADKHRLKEAHKPKHAAISLAGEPTLYPYLDGLINEYHKRGFTTFLVTNGINPEALAKLGEQPTQLYVSLYATSKEMLSRLCRPRNSGTWGKIGETLELISSFSCPTVVRITLVRDFNMEDVKGFARLLGKAYPTYVEPKAYMHVGYSRKRLGFSNMPTHIEVRSFAIELAEKLGYNILDESKESRVVLLSRLDKASKLV
jgi:tRNA wybutosine-synthesizing protein 1